MCCVACLRVSAYTCLCMCALECVCVCVCAHEQGVRCTCVCAFKCLVYLCVYVSVRVGVCSFCVCVSA